MVPPEYESFEKVVIVGCVTRTLIQSDAAVVLTYRAMRSSYS
jgi:hypothetical protein